MKFNNNTIANLQDWQTQLTERDETLKKDQETLKEDQDAYDKLQALIQNTVSNHVDRVSMPLVKLNKSGVPTASQIRVMTCKIMNKSKRVVSLKELKCKLHDVFVPTKKTESKLTNHIYAVVQTLKDRKLIKGPKSGFSLTVKGKGKPKHWV